MSVSRMLSESQRKSLEAQARQFHAQVGAASQYLTSRKISEAAVKRFMLGYVAESDNPSIVGRLSIPYLTPAGVVNLKYRCIADHDCRGAENHAKYLYGDGGTRHNLFNAQTLLTAERVVVCEGELDVVAAEMAGISAVGYPGVQSWKPNPHFRWCFDSVSDVAVVADGDDPGRKAAKEVAASLRDAVDASVRVVYLPDGSDTNSFIAEYGDVDYLERIGWLA